MFVEDFSPHSGTVLAVLLMALLVVMLVMALVKLDVKGF